MAGGNYFIKSDYKSRVEPIYYDNRPLAESDIIHQPDAYLFAAHLAAKYGADAIIDIGCGSARKLMRIEGVRRIGVDFGVNLDFCREKYPNETWLCANLETCTALDIDEATVRKSIIICADVLEHMGTPENLLKLLAQLNRGALATIITTPERDLVRGKNDSGPPANTAHVREWSLPELSSLLIAYDLPPAFIGLTVNNNINLEKKTIIAIADHRIGFLKSSTPPRDFRPLAIVASFNDSEIIAEIVSKLLKDDIDVHVLDNWSDDGTYEIVKGMSRIYSGLSIERFPDDKARGFNWAVTLDEKAKIAAQHPGRWIIHHDSDEIRETPWLGMSLRAGLWLADQCGCNAVDFTVLDFRPTDSRFVAGCELEKTLKMFEFGRRPGHFVQTKVWKQGAELISLSQFGGHDARFSNRQVFPYKFILKHYPFRSPDHARRKVFRERRDRYSPDEKARGWHTQYDRYSPEDAFIWNREDLILFDDVDVRQNYLLELISGIGIVR